MTEQNTVLGIWMMVATSLIFAIQDGISRHLASEYGVLMVVMIRFWFLGLFVVALAARRAGGWRRATRSHQPLLQVIRGLLLVVEICVMVTGFTYLGLIESQAVFIAYPLLVAALSGPILGERVGWRRWSAIGVGFAGIMIILQPGFGVFSPYALLPLLAAFLFALYGLLTRFVARRDSAAVSFFWTGATGAVAMTLVGVWSWQPMTAPDWGWMGMLCLTSVAGHWTLIKAYDVAEASAVQPFAYLQLVFGGAIGMAVFNEALRWNVAAGAVVVVAAGLFTLWRARQVSAKPVATLPQQPVG